MAKKSGNSKLGVRIAMTAFGALLISQAGVISTDVCETGSRFERIHLDMQGIVTGLRECADAGALTAPVAWLAGPGALPEAKLTTSADSLTYVSGNYINLLMPDPWGRAYVANIEELRAGTNSVTVFCAGANGIIDTPLTATEAEGDDVLLHLD